MRRSFMLAVAAAVAVVALGLAALAVLGVLLDDRPRVPPGASLSDPDAVTVIEADDGGYLNFAGVSRDRRVMAYALDNEDGGTLVIADAVTGRVLAEHRVGAPRELWLAWKATTLEAATRVDGRCARAFVARAPRWRLRKVPCTGEHARKRETADRPPAPPDLRPLTQCDPSPTTKAPSRALWAVEVCYYPRGWEPEVEYDTRLVDRRGRFVAQLADLYGAVWAADGSLLALTEHGRRLERVPAATIERLAR